MMTQALTFNYLKIMIRKLILTTAALLTFLTSYSQSINDLEFLVGTWKVEGKETYEVWKKTSNELTGSSYTIKNGEKIVTENLFIKTLNGNIVYEAMVLNQNEGKPIAFTLNSNTANGYSFENPTHDFPTKIIYRKISNSEMTVEVLGADDQGFSLKFIRQENH